jgi:GNAT superfamily N-acetyltransferase
MVDVSTIYLLESAGQQAVPAELRDAIEVAQLQDWKAHWQPALIAILQEMDRRGVPRSQWPQSWHWNWEAKSAQVQGLLAFRGFSVTCGGMTQGLMRVDLTKFAREPSQAGKPLVYVDYLEVAPWNRAELDQTPRLKGVGSALVTAAVALSEEEGFKGRIGLHSLPQADAFYRDRCGMSDLGPDPAVQNLRYFELTADRAQAFLEEEHEG